MKLHCGIIYSHPSSKICLPPTLFAYESIIKNKIVKYLSYNLSFSNADWDYPFDLCASIYRLSDIESIISIIIDKSVEDNKTWSLSSPNKFEVLGNLVMKSIFNSFTGKGYEKCLLPVNQVAVVVTINRYIFFIC